MKSTNQYSVIIPSHNRAFQLSLTLASFQNQTIPADRFEVIVIDDGSMDGTEEQLRSFSPEYDFDYKILPAQSGQGLARNIGVGISNYENVIFCDSDMLVSPEFIEVFDSYRSENNAQVISGTPNCFRGIYTQVFPDFSEGEQKRCKSVLENSGLWNKEYKNIESPIPLISIDEVRSGSDSIRKLISPTDVVGPELQREFYNRDYAAWLLFISRCILVNKSFFLSVGGFDERIFRGEDWELGYRMSKNGAQFSIVDEEICFHQEHPSAMRELSKGEKFNKVLLSKFGMDDPELCYLSIFSSSDDLWQNIPLYKKLIRSSESGDGPIDRRSLPVIKRAFRNLARNLVNS